MRPLMCLLKPTIWTLVLSNGVRLRCFRSARLSLYSWKFSSPPLSLMNRMDPESGAQKYSRIGRVFSLVTARALVKSDLGASQILSTPSSGAIQDSHFPSGLTRPATRLGLPNSLLRSISGGAETSAAVATKLVKQLAARIVMVAISLLIVIGIGSQSSTEFQAYRIQPSLALR